jgi:hypothetical protein
MFRGSSAAIVFLALGVACGRWDYSTATECSAEPCRATPAVTDVSFHVSPSGDDARSCAEAGDEATPKRTLNDAVQCLSPGATLVVHAGTYVEALDDVISAGTSWSAPVTLRAAPGELVTLRPAGGAYAIRIYGSQRAYIAIEGFVVDGRNLTRDAINITGPGSPATAPHHIRLRDLEVLNAAEAGVYLGGYTQHNELTRLRVHDNLRASVDQQAGIEVEHGGRNTIEDCEIFNHQGDGIVLHTGEVTEPGWESQDVVRRNDAHDNREQGIHLYGGAGRSQVYDNRAWNNWGGVTLSYGPANVLIYNNVVWNNDKGGGCGLLLHDGVDDAKIYNNTSFSNPYGLCIVAYQAGWDSHRVLVKNNVVFANDQDLNDLGLGTIFESNLIGVDPGFVDASSADLRLRSDSAARDAGVALADVMTDIDGVPRPQGSAYDIGAFEYVP